MVMVRNKFMVIQHAGIQGKWNDYQNFNESKLLIIGSFNPFNPNGNNTDFYYGRCSNYFWKAIADIQGKDQNFYCKNLNAKLQIMNEKKFCFLDLIDSIEVTSENDFAVNEFIENKVLKEFSDQKIFTNRTDFNSVSISITANYNKKIIEILRDSKSIKKVLHTLGNSTINQNFVGTKQKRLKEKGLYGFIESLKASHENIEFIGKSYSPAKRAVLTGGEQYYPNLKIGRASCRERV